MERWNDFDKTEQQSAHFSVEAWERLFGGDRALNGRDMIEVNSTDGQKIYTVGIPYMPYTNDEKENDILYLPGMSYSIDDSMLGGIRVIKREEIPDATSITLKVEDQEFHHIDYKEELEKILSSKAILEVGDILEVLGFEVTVVDLQPSQRVFCHGEEVEILFEALALPTPEAAQPEPAPQPPMIPEFLQSSGFVPFSGKGFRLGA